MKIKYLQVIEVAHHFTVCKVLSHMLTQLRLDIAWWESQRKETLQYGVS